jgi:hypothetical protein
VGSCPPEWADSGRAGDTRHASDIIPIGDAHIQTIMVRSREAFEARSAGVVTGSFVRVITGNLKNFCGTVGEVFGSRAKVKIVLKTKHIWLETEILNLLNLDRVPPELRTWYYNSSLDALVPGLIAEDLRRPDPESRGPETETGGSLYVSVRMTAFLRKLIVGGELNPAILAQTTVAAMLAGRVMLVSSVRAFRSTLVGALMQTVRQEGAQNYGQFLKQNRQYQLNIHEIRQIVEPLGLPETSPGYQRGWVKGQRRFKKR